MSSTGRGKGSIISTSAMDALLKRINQLAMQGGGEKSLSLPAATSDSSTINNANAAKQPTSLLNHELQVGLRRQSLVASRMSTTMTRHGVRRDTILGRIATRLAMRYGRPDALAIAVDAIRPVVRYHKEPVLRKSWIPMALPEGPSIGLAIRWILGNAKAKEYFGTTGVRRRDLERAVEEELVAILDGSSNLYAKRLQFHRSPN